MTQDVAGPTSIRSVRLLSLAGIAAVALLALVAGLTTYLLTSSGSETGKPRISSPEILTSPVQRSGPGWTLETRVSNLLALDLAVAVEADRYPGLRIALVDVNSGLTAAVGTFGSNPFVRLRSNPPELLVSDLDQGTGQHRLLIFAIRDADIVPAAEVTLPLRHGYTGFANAMQLSENERFLFVPERSVADRVECHQATFDGEACFNYLLGVIDLDLSPPTHVESVPLPGYCGGITLSAVGDEDVVARCLSGGSFLVSVQGSSGEPLVQELVRPPSGPAEGSVLGPLEYATVLPDGAIRLLQSDGAVRTAPGEFLSHSVLPINHGVIRAEKIDDRRILVLAGPRQGGQILISEFVVLDLVEPKVERRIQAPLGTVSVSVLSHDRAAILLRTDQTYQIREIDLATGQLGDPVPLQGLPGGPDAVVR